MNNFSSHYIPEKTEDLRKWHNSVAQSFFEKLGLKKNHTLLDFGCGAGNYVIPAAKIVSKEGKVYALDKEQIVIDYISNQAKELELFPQLSPIKTTGELSFPIFNNSVDFTLIFDVIGSIGNKQGKEGISVLVQELNRITKEGGKVILALKHLRQSRIPKETTLGLFKKYFRLEKEEVMTHLHWDHLEDDIVTFLTKH